MSTQELTQTATNAPALIDPCGFTVPPNAIDILTTERMRYINLLESRGIDAREWRPPAENAVIYDKRFELLLKYLILGHIADAHTNLTEGAPFIPVTRRCVGSYIGSVLGSQETYNRFQELPYYFDKTTGMFSIDRHIIKDLEPANDVTMKGQLFFLRHSFFRVRGLILDKKA